jgi:membrane protease subunit HflC
MLDRLFCQSVRAQNLAFSIDRLHVLDIIRNGLREEFRKRTIPQLVSGDRSQVMGILTERLTEAGRSLGVSIVDVRIKRIELSEQVSESVFDRMRAERERVAKDFRARGAEAAERIRANADREREVILAQAYREAEVVRGEGDAKAADIYAKAYNRNSEFYNFYRSLGGYREG